MYLERNRVLIPLPVKQTLLKRSSQGCHRQLTAFISKGMIMGKLQYCKEFNHLICRVIKTVSEWKPTTLNAECLGLLTGRGISAVEITAATLTIVSTWTLVN